MDLKEFKETQKELSALMEEFGEDAKKHGVLPVGKEYQGVATELKKRILEKAGVDIEEYSEMEKTFGSGEDLWEQVQKSRAGEFARKIWHLGRKEL